MICSKLVNEVVEGGNAFLETLALAGLGDDFGGLGGGIEGVSIEELPMVEHALWECSAGSGSSESLGETEGLSDWQVGLDHHEWSALDWLFGDDDTTTLGHALVDATDGVIWALDLDEEDWLLESGLCGQLTSVEDTSGGWDNLTTTSVDSIGVESNILNVESDAAHVFVGHHALLGGPLEGSFHGVLNFVQVLALGGHIDEQVGASRLWAEAPDLLGIIGVPFVVVSHNSVAVLGILLCANLISFDGVREIVTEG